MDGVHNRCVFLILCGLHSQPEGPGSIPVVGTGKWQPGGLGSPALYIGLGLVCQRQSSPIPGAVPMGTVLVNTCY